MVTIIITITNLTVKLTGNNSKATIANIITVGKHYYLMKVVIIYFGRDFF